MDELPYASLSSAVEANDVVHLESMLNARPAIKIRKSFLSKLLFEAASLGHDGIVALLLKHDADPTVVDQSQITPFLIAVYNERYRVLTQLLRHDQRLMHFFSRDALHDNAISMAIRNRHVDMLNFLLDRGGNINEKDSPAFKFVPWSACGLAIEYNLPSRSLRLLLNKGADPDKGHMITPGKTTALWLAVKKHCEGADMMLSIACLLEHGANPNYFFLNEPPLGFSCINDKNVELTKCLLDHGADPNHFFWKQNVTPLYAACAQEASKTAVLLIQYGADPKKKSCLNQYLAFHPPMQRGQFDFIISLVTAWHQRRVASRFFVVWRYAVKIIIHRNRIQQRILLNMFKSWQQVVEHKNRQQRLLREALIFKNKQILKKYFTKWVGAVDELKKKRQLLLNHYVFLWKSNTKINIYLRKSDRRKLLRSFRFWQEHIEKKRYRDNVLVRRFLLKRVFYSWLRLVRSEHEKRITNRYFGRWKVYVHNQKKIKKIIYLSSAHRELSNHYFYLNQQMSHIVFCKFQSDCALFNMVSNTSDSGHATYQASAAYLSGYRIYLENIFLHTGCLIRSVVKCLNDLNEENDRAIKQEDCQRLLRHALVENLPRLVTALAYLGTDLNWCSDAFEHPLVIAARHRSLDALSALSLAGSELTYNCERPYRQEPLVRLFLPTHDSVVLINLLAGGIGLDILLVQAMSVDLPLVCVLMILECAHRVLGGQLQSSRTVESLPVEYKKIRCEKIGFFRAEVTKACEVTGANVSQGKATMRLNPLVTQCFERVGCSLAATGEVDMLWQRFYGSEQKITLRGVGEDLSLIVGEECIPCRYQDFLLPISSAPSML